MLLQVYQLIVYHWILLTFTGVAVVECSMFPEITPPHYHSYQILLLVH